MAVHSEFNEGGVRAHSLPEGKEIRRRRGEVKWGILLKGNREMSDVQGDRWKFHGNDTCMGCWEWQSDRRREKAHGTYILSFYKHTHTLHSKQIWEWLVYLYPKFSTLAQVFSSNIDLWFQSVSSSPQVCPEPLPEYQARCEVLWKQRGGCPVVLSLGGMQEVKCCTFHSAC